MRVIAIMNQQQAVGKSTTALNLAHGLARMGFNVALIDLDPVMSLTRHLNLSQQNEGLDAVMHGNKSLDEVSVLIRDNLSFVAAGQKLVEIEEGSGTGIARGYILQQALQDPKFTRHDFVILDCAALSGLMAMNAMLAAKEVLMPILPNAASITKLIDMITILKQFLAAGVSSPRLWLVMNQSSHANPGIVKIRDTISKVFSGRVLTTMLQSYPRLQQQAYTGKSLFDYNDNDQSAIDFHTLAEDLVNGRTADG